MKPWSALPAALAALAALCALFLAAGCIGSADGGGSETEYLTGKALLPTGEWAAKARITIRPAAYLADPAKPAPAGARDLVANNAGIWKAGGLPAGDYVVEMRHGDNLGVTLKATLAKGQGAKLEARLEIVGSITFRVDDASGGPAAFLQVYGMERRVALPPSRNVPVMLPAGDYHVRVSAGESPDTAAHFTHVVVKAGRDTSLGAISLKALDPKPPAVLIFDSNIGFAADDAGAVSILHSLADLGEARILAMGTALPSRWSAAALDVLNTFHRRGSLPVGAWKGEAQVAQGAAYDATLLTEYGSDLPAWDALPQAAALYRTALAGEPDNSVTVLANGTLYNLWALLRSDRDLVARKVKQLVVVGGLHPSGKEFNFSGGIARDTLPNVTAEVVDAWPGPVVFHGHDAGIGVEAGSCLEAKPATHPVRRAYSLSVPGPGLKSPATDLAATYFAVRGPDRFWTQVQGRNQVAADGSNTFTPSATGTHAYLVRALPPDSLAAALDSLLCMDP